MTYTKADRTKKWLDKIHSIIQRRVDNDRALMLPHCPTCSDTPTLITLDKSYYCRHCHRTFDEKGKVIK